MCDYTKLKCTLQTFMRKKIILLLLIIIMNINPYIFGKQDISFQFDSNSIVNSKNNLSEEKIIVYEPNRNNILVKRDSIIIAGQRKESSINDIKIKNNSMEKKEQLKDIFHLTIKLFPGENDIKISSKEDMIFNMKVYYQKEGDSSPVANKYESYVFHAEKVNEFCEKCHIVDANKGKKNNCYIQCHNDMVKQDVIKPHGPIGEGACLACHDPDGVASGYAPFLEGGEICYTCHEKFTSGKYIHTATEMGDCMVCHDPHGSQYPFFIREPENKICFKCHANMTERQENIYDSTGENILRTEVRTVKYQHAPVKEGLCLKCHDPHFSDYSKANLRKRITALCKDRDCHVAILEKLDKHFHAYDIFIKLGSSVILPKDLRKDEYNKIVCYSCHDPHGSNNEKLLRKPSEILCPWCHVNMPKKSENEEKDKIE
ncbi:hypothetical protein HY745_03090 [Candidatus Desantisbacteria bacterium]|nr:hypothetical protein [Candidatus Desantisbacteria bacterium]